MAASIPNQPINNVNCPECGYQNVSGAEKCSGTKKDGTPCEKPLAVVVK
jgi:hypothetical protein